MNTTVQGCQEETRAVERGVMQWFATGSVGASSSHMATTACGHPGNGLTPCDPDDLSRCIALVEMVPAIRDRFPRIAESSAQWKIVIDHWDELVALFREESKGQRYFNAPRTYARMKQLGL